jgi:acetyltransferase-like isoleucine patch superfamily enzyme
MKAVMKAAANSACSIAILPIACGWLLLRFLTRRELGFTTLTQAMSLIPGRSGVYLRRAMYRWCLPQIGEDCQIGFGTLLTSSKTRFGNRVYVGPYCMLGTVTIESDVLIASHVSIINGGHQHGGDQIDVPMRDQPGEFPNVTIGEGAWLGERSMVMCDVGRHCIIGAGAVVTKPLPDYAVAVGIPARIVRFRDDLRAVGRESTPSPAVVMS